MLFAGLAVSAAVDLLSQFLPEKASAKSGAGAAAPTPFNVADLAASDAAPAQPQSTSASGGTEGLSRDALDTLLSEQGQGSHHKKHSMSVLLGLMQTSQDGGVKKTEFDAAAGEDDNDAAKLFEQIDQNHDNSVNAAELSGFLDTYRRNAQAGTQGKTRALAMVA